MINEEVIKIDIKSSKIKKTTLGDVGRTIGKKIIWIKNKLNKQNVTLSTAKLDLKNHLSIEALPKF